MPSRDVLRYVVTSWSPGYKPSWTIAQVRTALKLHAEGDFSQSAQLVDAFGEDDVLPGLMEKWLDAVLKSEFELRPVEEPNPRLSKRIVKEFSPRWWKTFPEDTLSEWLAWYRWIGVGPAVFDWTSGGSRWDAVLRELHPQFLRRDEFNQKWIYQAREGQLEPIAGNGKWLILTDGQRGWMRGLVRSIALDWIIKQLTIRDWNRYNERHGLPLIKAMVPAIAEEGDKDQFFEDLKGLANETVVQLPTHLGDESVAKEISYDLELLEAKDRSFESFPAQLDRIDRRFMLRILGSNLSTEVNDQGARSAAETHQGETQSKATAVACKLATEIREQGLFPLVAYNVPNVTLEVVPWPHWDTEPPEDTKLEAEDQKLFGEAIKAVQDAGYDIENLDELAEKHGLILKKREEPEPVAPNTPDDPEEEETDEEDDDADEPEAARAEAEDNGQKYTERLIKRSSAHGAKSTAAVIATMVSAVSQAGDYEEAKRLIVEKYGKLAAPSELASLTEAALTMAQLGGHLAITEDVEA